MVLRELMAVKGYSFKNLSDSSGVSISVIEYIAYGRTKNPHPETMRKIANTLGVEISEVDEFAAAVENRLKKSAAVLTHYSLTATDNKAKVGVLAPAFAVL